MVPPMWPEPITPILSLLCADARPGSDALRISAPLAPIKKGPTLAVYGIVLWHRNLLGIEVLPLPRAI